MPDGRASRLAPSAAFALVAAVAVLWAVRFALPDEPLLRGTSDLRNYFYPLYDGFYGEVAQGRLPLWDPNHLAGTPQLATLQGGFFYPPHLLYVLLPTHLALAASHLLHLVWIALSTALLLRALGLGTAAACAGAAIFTLRGAVQWWLQWPAMLETAAWIPLGALAVLRIARGGGTAPACALALATGMALLAGHVQVAGYALWIWSTLFVAVWASEPGRRVQSAAWLAGALVVGVLLSAAQTLPTFELTRAGTRELGGIAASQVLAMGRGGLRSFDEWIFASQFSFGAVTLALAPAALLAGRPRAIAWWALALGAAALAIASISGDAGVAWYRAIPAIGWFRSPRRILFVAGLCASVLAAIGFDALCGRDRRRSATAALALGAAALAVAAVSALRGHGAIAALALATVGVAAAARRVRSPSPRAGALIALAAAGLVCADLALARSISGRLPYRAVDAAEYRRNAALFSHLAELAGDERALWLPLPRSRDLKLAGRYGLRRLDDFEPLNLRRQSEYFTYFQLGRSRDPGAKRFFAGEVIPERRLPERQLVAEMREMAGRRRLLDLAGARLFVTPAALDPLQRSAAESFARAAGLTERSSFAGAVIARNPRVVPRAFVTYRARPAPGVDALLARLAEPDFDPLASSFVEGDFAPPADGPPRGAPARIALDTPRAVEVEAELAADGLVVLADSHYPGWVATVDGQRAPILPTNHLFRGVPAPAGRHRIRFEYRPASATAGAATSLAAALGLGFGWLRSRARRG